jgi:hypothetical protein
MLGIPLFMKTKVEIEQFIYDKMLVETVKYKDGWYIG